MNRIRTGVLAVVCLTYLNVSAQTATLQMSLEDVRALSMGGRGLTHGKMLTMRHLCCLLFSIVPM